MLPLLRDDMNIVFRAVPVENRADVRRAVLLQGKTTELFSATGGADLKQNRHMAEGFAEAPPEELPEVATGLAIEVIMGPTEETTKALTEEPAGDPASESAKASTESLATGLAMEVIIKSAEGPAKVPADGLTTGLTMGLIDEPEATNPVNEFPLAEKFRQEVDSILQSHTAMFPFQKQSREVKWVRISLEEELSMPDYASDLLKKPFTIEAYEKYNHLLLGKTCDDGPLRYYIGVPALYDAADKLIGFRQFKCSADAEPSVGDYGYWLIFITP